MSDTNEAGFDLRILPANRLRLLLHRGILRLTLEGERSWIRVSPARAFPISDPDRYIGFLDGAGKDIGVLPNTSDLDPDSKRLLDEELELRYFVPTVNRVIEAKEEFGSVYWTVETSRGRAEFIVRNLKDNLHELGGNRVIITDVEGNRFEIPDITRVDPKSADILIRSL